MTDIEAALADEFDAEHLAVYADYLQGLGDPRGELIALDLDGRTDGREEILARWLGDLADTLGPAIEVGFITDLDIDADTPLDAILASPAGPFIRGATIHGSGELVASALGKLAAREHGWLERLSVQAMTPRANVAVDLGTAMPALTEIEVWGHAVFDALAHPRVRALRITGHDAIATPRLPAVAVLDFAADGRPGQRADDVTPPTLPALRHLDLSRNEPGRLGAHYLAGEVDACRLLARWPTQLTGARLPSVRTREQVAELGRAPVRQLATARAYHEHRHLALPGHVVLPPAFPWRPADLLEGATLNIHVDGTTYGLAVPDLVIALECHPGIPEPLDETWARLLRPTGWARAPRADVTAAIALLDGVDGLADLQAALYRGTGDWLEVAIEA